MRLESNSRRHVRRNRWRTAILAGVTLLGIAAGGPLVVGSLPQADAADPIVPVGWDEFWRPADSKQPYQPVLAPVLASQTAVASPVAASPTNVVPRVSTTPPPTVIPPTATPPAATPAPSATPSPVSAPPPAAPTLTTPSLTGRRVVGYFPLWARNSGYTEASIDFAAVNVVTHFALTPLADGSLKIPDWGPFPDTRLVAATHAAGAKIVIVIGGDDAPATAGFAAAASTAAGRQRLATNIQNIVAANGYDGVDLDWEFPVSSADRDNLTQLVSAIRTAIGPAKTLSLAAPGSSWSGQWLDIPALTPLVDWIGSMTYTLSGSTWSPRSDHNSALYSVDNQALSLDGARAYYIGRGLPASKLLLGVGFYGQRFDGASAMYQPLANTAGSSPSYPEIAALVGNGWTLHRDAAAGVPYITKDSGLGVISYDDPTSIGLKCQYVKDKGLGGMITWSMGQDRIGGAQPLLAAMRSCRQ